VAAYTHGRDVEIIPNVVDTEYFSPSARRPPRGPFRFVAIAILVKSKGVHFLIEALSKVREIDAVLEVVGDGPERSRLERLAADLGLAGRVNFLGRLARGGVREALWRADALVVASVRETFGVVVVEAMSCGLPVVATISGGPEDVIEERSGVLVPPGDVDALAAALAELVRDRDVWTARRDEIRRRVEERFGERAVVQALLQMYGRALAAGEPRS
jgi:glycosyltransferase involved in cell wall biosynthesis